jgi:hypothetical protein
MEDWEKEYERDRQRIAAGEDIGTLGKRRSDDDDPFQDRSKYTPPALGAGGPQPDPPPPPPVKRNEDSKEEDAMVAAYYAKYDVQESSKGASTSSNGVVDDRLGLPLATFPRSLEPLFSAKFGRFVYYVESVTMYYKGFFSPKERPMTCIVTPHAMYLGDPTTGELVTCRSIASIREVQLFGEVSIGLRSTDGDIFMMMLGKRQEFVNAVQKLSNFLGTPLQLRTMPLDAEKTFKKEIQYVDRKESSWVPCEDPRTGLALVEIPQQFQASYAPLIPKILHWFGGVNQYTKDWKGSIQKERRGFWVTATSMYLCKPGGPQSDGRDITRCMGIEYIGDVFDGRDGDVGIVVKGGPQQPHLGLCFDSYDQKKKVIECISVCFNYRKKETLKITKVESLERAIKIEKEGGHKPELFIMRTKAELFGLLRGKSEMKVQPS